MDEIVDFEYLLSPIETPIEAPRIVRFEIRSKRNAEFDKEEKHRNFIEYGPEFGEEKAPEPAEWSGFIRDCETHLAKKVKDLWVCAWYCEALLIRDSFAGLAAGFQLSRQMIEQYWDVIEPRPEAEDGMEDTVRMFAGLNSGTSFIDRLMLTPISVASADHPPLSTATLDTVEESVRAQLISNSDDAFQQQLGNAIQTAISSFADLNKVFDEKCGSDAPPSVRLRDALLNVQKRILEIYPNLQIVEAEAKVGETELVTSSAAGIGVGNLAGGNHIQNREEAFKLLERVSKFFRENEPSSPVSYALLQAVRWGRMSLPDLLNDLIEDGDAKTQVFRMTGLKPGGSEESNEE
jgi:type VI secretion system protein ImpA